MTIDGEGMFVAALSTRLAASQTRQVFVGVVLSATAAPTVGGAPRVVVRVNGGDPIALTWVSSSVRSQITSTNVVGLPIQVVSNEGQWAGLEILIPCGKA
jgi:hypothetical protein